MAYRAKWQVLIVGIFFGLVTVTILAPPGIATASERAKEAAPAAHFIEHKDQQKVWYVSLEKIFRWIIAGVDTDDEYEVTCPWKKVKKEEAPAAAPAAK